MCWGLLLYILPHPWGIYQGKASSSSASRSSDAAGRLTLAAYAMAMCANAASAFARIVQLALEPLAKVGYAENFAGAQGLEIPLIISNKPFP